MRHARVRAWTSRPPGDHQVTAPESQPEWPPDRCRVRVCRDCCCGTSRKHPGVDHDDLLDRLVAGTRGHADVEVTPCLLACDRSNVVVVSPGAAGRAAGARPVWFAEVLGVVETEAVAAWVRQGGPGRSQVPERLAALVTRPDALAEQALR